jgi:hypothetical protein
MQHTKPGDLVHWRTRGRTYAFLVTSKSAFFGCQWTIAFHNEVEPENLKDELESSFYALIDFIEPRRGKELVRVATKVEATTPSLERMKAWVEHPRGQEQWYIYDQAFNILERRPHLKPEELSYPIALGMSAREACVLIDKKWKNAQVFQGPHGKNFPHSQGAA